MYSPTGMTTALAFDVYGTLIDTAGVVTTLGGMIGDRAAGFASLWREKQLEYSFRRALMRRYEVFAVCVGDALDFCCASLDVTLTEAQREALLAAYRHLPAFEDARMSLAGLDRDRFAAYAFSNGTREAVETLLEGAGIRDHFVDVVSVDEIGSFKPNPDVYHHFLSRSGAAAGRAWLISGNPFDVIGALGVGMKSAWIRRSAKAVFDPWRVEPTLTLAGLEALGDRIAAYHAKESSR